MAHSKWDLKSYQHFLNAFSLIVALIVTLWVGFSHLNFAILLLCIGLGLTAILGLAKMKRALFTFPFLIFAIIILYGVVNESSKELIAQTTLTL
jgi:apolipoprotein N-acyltransferase